VFVIVRNIAAISEGSASHVDCCNVPWQLLITGCWKTQQTRSRGSVS